MHNSILPQDQDGQEPFNAISSFFSRFKIGNAWFEVNSLVYDPLFAHAKSFTNNYDVTYAVYEEPNPKLKYRI